jgi:hypothetical protein
VARQLIDLPVPRQPVSPEGENLTVSLGYVKRLSLSSADTTGTVPATVNAGSVEALTAEHARLVLEREWGDDEVALVQGRVNGSDLLDDTNA